MQEQRNKIYFCHPSGIMYDYNRTASRNYTNAEKNAADIAYEVVAEGESDGWSASDDRATKIATKIEGILADFNIGYVDDMKGTWKKKPGGSKFFRG
jgi:hypothetical protein